MSPKGSNGKHPQPATNGNGAPVGAVMVVGGGIAGMQASLDLAESGYKVYLVEKKSAIGGHMAQLDKTFPTNDCAMCTISPKLVETAAHLNIELLTDSELVKLDGEAGHFTATVYTHPRYIDVEKCTGCGECADVCPVIIPGHFDEGLAQQRAAHKLYPQAAPNAYAIEKRGIAPCRDACPAGQRAQGYIALIHEGRYHDALRVIREDNPFPGICGRICNHRCEEACNRNLVDDPINIHALKRFVTAKVYAEERVPPEPCEIKYDQRVAVIGAGPCGLTAAQDLCMAGYPVTVFEALPVAGGMLRVGVPEYRLPSWIVDREVQDIVDLGVELRLNTQVDNLDDLFDQGFSAVLIAVGAHEGIRLPIPGTNLEGVLINTAFLRDVRLDNAPDIAGKRVLVLGGGNVAIDVARTAVRLGAQVSMSCLESKDKMPSHDWEVRAAEEEGVTIYPSRTFLEIVSDGNNRVGGVKCAEVAAFSFDAMGRLELERVPDSEHVLDCDVVIFSVGQRAGLAFIPDDAGVGLTSRRTIAINPNTLAATREGVFAAGDSVSGTAFVIEAVASGHTAAESIRRYLQSEYLEPPPKPELPVVKLTRDEIQDRMRTGEVKVTPRVPVPELKIEDRLGSFAEVELGYTDEQAQAEAARCLACGVCSECLSCWYQCGVGAVDHDMVAMEQQIEVGAVILSPGFEVYHAEQSAEYGWGRYPNVVTALQFERLLSASGPTMGHVKRLSDGAPAKKIAFLQCVGSRDQNHDYCSAVCCMYATKEAIMAIEHEPDTEVHVFLMDMRAFSKGYEEYYRRSREKYGIQYTRCRLSSVKENPANGNLIVRYLPGDNSKLVEEEFDLLVLSVGMEISLSVRQMGHKIGVALDEYGFARTAPLAPLLTSRPGVYAIGPFRGPKDIPESVVEASGAAAVAAGLLAPARDTLTRKIEYPPERDIRQEEPQVGVFVCHCGSNIGGFLDVPDVAEYAESLPNVVHTEHNLYTCSQDSIIHITEQVKELGLNRVVVASCTPLTHEPLFQSCIRAAGLNEHLFEMANIRNQCSWVHSNDRPGATQKAKDLVRMAVARASELEPLHTQEVPVQKTALVIGGGVAGMTAALNLAQQGFPVHLVEREGELGGNLRHVRYFGDWLDIGDWILGSSPQAYLVDLVERVKNNPLITVHLQTELTETTGFKGNFTSVLHNNQSPIPNTPIKHGVTIVATGAVEYKGREYGYGSDPCIVTQQEFEALLGGLDTRDSGSGNSEFKEPPNTESPIPNPQSPSPNSVVMIQCAGRPSEKFCSRICCTQALKNALKLKELNPQAQVTIIYRDIRAYGFKERLYTEARKKGVLFIHYDFDRKPQVSVNRDSGFGNSEPGANPESRITESRITVHVHESQLDRDLALQPDMLVLSMPIVPPHDADELASRLKVSVDLDGFFLEAHVKLRPVDFSSDGMYVAGMAHYPKLLDETIVQAQAAAARAALILSKDTMTTSALVAHVNPELCVGCLTCVRICPYDVPRINPELAGIGGILGAAEIESVICHGCGSCAAECPAKAIEMMHYKDAQVLKKLDALFV
jgi:heterodisulfide reductase subunit A-like polyferredoxin